MKSRFLIRLAGLVLAVVVALASAGCDAVVGVGVGYLYPGAWGPYGGGRVGGWYGGPVW